MEDAVTSNPAPPHVISLPDDEDEAPLRVRRNRKASAGETPQSTPAPEAVARDGGDTTRASVTFANPLASARPSTSTVNPPSLFATHHVPEDQVGAAKEAIRQAGIMMEQVKVVREASQAAYDASSALQSNVQKSCELVALYTELENKQIQLDLDLKLAQQNLQKARDEAKDELEEALKKKDQDLAEAQKEASSKTKLAEEKLASVGTLEQENSRLKTALETANREVSRLKKDKMVLHDQAGELAGKVNDLEAYLGGLAKKLFVMLEEFCQSFEEETSRVEPGLDPANSLVKDEAAMNVLRLESRVTSVVDYLARLKVAMSRIDTSLWPGTTLQNDLESLMVRLDEVPGRVAEWKKSSARCGADVALSLVRVHCKEAREEKLAAIQVANTRKHSFQDFMETFIAAATRIVDGIDLDEFVAPSSPPLEE
ncbi:myosin-7B [Triticum aestivum]|uniref:myosin-7B n=1 Tax=Triticum aestivum TaxID=4565 RepID=UPI001D02554E|nr:myosin-7B-like [Triticum aestivum]